MDFHAVVETFAEVWVAATTPTAVNTVQEAKKAVDLEHFTTQLPRKPILVTKITPTSPPPSQTTPPLPPDDTAISASGTRSLPIHCIIEQTSGTPSFDNSSGEKSTHTSVELDSYAILPGTTLLSDCVTAAIIKLGYTSSDAIGAKGAVQIKNWKPLCFEAISDSKSASIEEILGELTQVATLRIRICSSSKVNSASEVKEKLLQLLLSQSQTGLLNDSQSGEEASMFTNGHATPPVSTEMRKAFDKWYEEQLKSYTEANGNSTGNVDFATAAKSLLAMQQERINLAITSMQQRGNTGSPAGNEEEKDKLSPQSQVSPPAVRPSATSTPYDVSPSLHPALQSPYLPGKTRMRTSFDPEREIPRLQKWFSDNQHPSRELMLHYLGELNSLDSRKGRRPLDLTNIIYWFKNARAAHRRATKNSEDDSFEMEDEKDLTLPIATSAGEGLPFLPNRNAVYMVPYPHYPHMGLNNHLGLLNVQNRLAGQADDKGPCDLSLNSRRSLSSSSYSPKSSSPPLTVTNGDKRNSETSSTTPSPSPTATDEIDGCKQSNNNDSLKVKVEVESPEHSPSRSDEGYAEMTESSPERRPSSPQPTNLKLKVPDHHIKCEQQSAIYELPKDFSQEKPVDKQSYNSVEPEDLTKSRSLDLTMNKSVQSFDSNKPRDLSQYKPDKLMNENGKRPYESDDDLESDYEDDDERSIDGSVSSHDERKRSHLESYINGARSLNYNPVVSSPSSQPLHIPQFPHPLAMHYFPLNTHLYSQQANHLKLNNHNHHEHHSGHTPQSTTKTTPGSGQENNSHRKRRTRVFIDPLSEIPKLEKWFLDDTHPSSYMIDKYSEELNSSDYRQKFPRLEPKNVQLWFKNHRAKVKRMRVGGVGDHMMFD